jgi:hypothetical protein
LLKALLMKEKHASENRKFDSMFPESLRNEWVLMIRTWERNHSKPNPFTHVEKGTWGYAFRSFMFVHVRLASKVAELRKKLAEEDKEEIRRGTALHQVPVSVFIRNGLEIEEQQ